MNGITPVVLLPALYSDLLHKQRKYATMDQKVLHGERRIVVLRDQRTCI